MFKISSTPSPILPLMASNVGIHILGKNISKKIKNQSEFDIASLPDSMQSFRRCTVSIRTDRDEFLDSSQAVRITRFKSRVLVDDKMMIIIWTKHEIDVGPYSWRGLVCEAQAH